MSVRVAVHDTIPRFYLKVPKIFMHELKQLVPILHGHCGQAVIAGTSTCSEASRMGDRCLLGGEQRIRFRGRRGRSGRMGRMGAAAVGADGATLLAVDLR